MQLEAQIARINPSAQFNVRSPFILDGQAGVANTIYDKAQDGQFGAIYIQNLGLTPVKYAFNHVASANNFHGVLAAGASLDDGTGAQVEVLGRLGVVTISLYGAATYRVSVNRYLLIA